MSYLRGNEDENYRSTEKIYPKQKDPRTRLIIVIPITITLTLAISFGLVIVFRPFSPTPTATVQPTVPTQAVVTTPIMTSGGYCGLGTWASTSVSPNQTVQGPAVIDGVYSVSGHSFALGGTNKVGYIAVLEDTGTYTVNSNGTACQPFTGKPSQSDVQTVINALVQDQRMNGCTGGCATSRIQKFAGGNPDGGPTNQ